LETFRNDPEIWLERRKEAAPTPAWELEFSEKIMSAYVSLKGDRIMYLLMAIVL
jgi:hypothetical protein